MTTWIGHQYLSQPECWAQRHLKNQSLYGNKHCWQGSNMTDFETSPDGQGKSCQRKPFEQAKNNLLCMLIRNLKKYRMNRMLCPLESKHRRHLKNQSLCGDKHCWQESNMRDFETLPDGQVKKCQRQPFEQAKKVYKCLLGILKSIEWTECCAP